MDRLFEDFGFRGISRELSPSHGRALWPFGEVSTIGVFVPEVEVFERDNCLCIRADLPGIKKEDIHVVCDSQGILIQGERKSSHEERREGFLHSERSYGSFCRRVPLPEGVDVESCEASFDDGVLEIRLTMPKESRRKIEIRSRTSKDEGVPEQPASSGQQEQEVRH